MNILSLDGGGVRGIMTAIVLEELNALSEKPLVDLFPYQVASSTGTIIQAASNHHVPYRDIVQLYHDQAKDIFHRTAWSRVTNPEGLFSAQYPDAGLEKLLRERLGNSTLAQYKQHLHFTTFDIQQRKFVTLNARDNPTLPVVEAIRRSTAAPYYFKPEDQCVDGGMGANNPALLGFSIAVKEGAKFDSTTVVSVGTGKVKSPINIGSAGLLQIVPKLPELFMGAEMSATDLMLSNFLGQRYHRIEFALTEEEDSMDNTSEANLNALEKVAETYIDDHKEDLKKLAKELNK